MCDRRRGKRRNATTATKATSSPAQRQASEFTDDDNKGTDEGKDGAKEPVTETQKNWDSEHQQISGKENREKPDEDTKEGVNETKVEALQDLKSNVKGETENSTVTPKEEVPLKKDEDMEWRKGFNRRS